MAQNYKDTLNLPKTEFPMKASLTSREPEILKTWEETRLYQQIQKARGYSCCMTAARPQSCHLTRRLPRHKLTTASRSGVCARRDCTAGATAHQCTL